jgi:arylsulfatase
MTLRKAIATILLLTSSITVGANERPNVVLVLMDNFGYGEVGVYGGGVMRGAPTPNIDSIAAQGLQLTNFNVEAECTPSRAALLTGRYGIRTRQRLGLPPRGVWYGITRWEVTLAELLSEARLCHRYFWKVASWRH